MTYLTDRGLTATTIKRFGLEEDDGAVDIPFFDALGRRVSSRIRQLGERVPKYLSSVGGGAHVYNVQDSARACVYVTEGEFDALVLKQLGLNACGIPGVEAWQRPWAWLFAHSELVNIVFDGDEPGRRAAARIAAQIGNLTEVNVLELPSGEDVTSLYLKDPGELRRLLGVP